MADVWLSEAAYIHLRMKTYGVKARPTQPTRMRTGKRHKVKFSSELAHPV